MQVSNPTSPGAGSLSQHLGLAVDPLESAASLSTLLFPPLLFLH
jgi:hypothetical protein